MKFFEKRGYSQGKNNEGYNQNYDQWANMTEGENNPQGGETHQYIHGDTQEEYSERVQEARQEAAKDIATQLGVDARILDNPRGMHMVERHISKVEYGEGRETGLIAEDDGGRRALDTDERSAVTEHVRSSGITTPEDAGMELRHMSLRGAMKNLEGMSVDDDGTVHTSSYSFYPRESRRTAFGMEQTIKTNPDGGLSVDRTDYSEGEDGSFHETVSSRAEYSPDGVQMRTETIILDDDGAISERIVTERDSANPFISKRTRYEGESKEPESESYGIIDMKNVGSIHYLQRREETDPRMDNLSFYSPDKALVFNDRSEADEYYSQNLSGQEYSVKTGGILEDDIMNKAVKEGIDKLASN